MFQKIKQVLKLILVRLKVISRQRNEYYQFRKLKLQQNVDIAKVKVVAHIVGCGAMGRHISQVVTSVRGWSVKSVYDVKHEAMDRLAHLLKQDVVKHARIDDIIANVAAEEILIIATTANTHF